MKFLDFGSLNIDYVYKVAKIVSPGQTIDSFEVNRFPGGKGLNQTLAAARAGIHIFHAGIIGTDGEDLRMLLEQDNVDCRYLKSSSVNTGSAFIQVDADGQNSIVLNGGANRCNTPEFCDEVLADFSEGDMILLQNEISCIDYLIEKAHNKKMSIVLNPSPINEAILNCDLKKVSIFVMNEDEGRKITGKTTSEDILSEMLKRYPDAKVVLTLGSRGAVYQDAEHYITQDAFKVKAVDTTAAGDTFTGYFLASLAQKKDIKDCLYIASKAAALAVTIKGASSSIPYFENVRVAEI